jgi:hypothetical protein
MARTNTLTQNHLRELLTYDPKIGTFARNVRMGSKHRWIAQIRLSNKSIHIGSFATPEEASIAYQNAKAKLHIKTPGV